MKISYLLSKLGKTGGSIVLYNFMDNLVKRGHEVFAILPKERIKWEVGIWKEKIETSPTGSKLSAPFNVVANTVKKLKKDAGTARIDHLRALTKGLIRNWVESEITISTFCLTAYAGYALSNRTIPLYHMQHFEEVFFKDEIGRLIARNTYYLPLSKMSNSIWLKNIISKQFDSESYLLNPGIDLSVFKPYKDIKEKYRAKKEWILLSYFDERRKWKGFDDAVHAVKVARERLEKKGVKINWKVFGLHPPAKKYCTEFEYIGKIFGEKLARIYSEADIVLLPSWYESFPLPPIEAMACGSLIITTRYGTEDYVMNEKNGLVCLPRDIDEMVNKIIYAVQNPERCLTMAENGLVTAKEYTWEKRTDVLEEIIKDAVNNYSFKRHELFDDLVNGDFKEYMNKEFEDK